jgi:uncharacterized protein
MSDENTGDGVPGGAVTVRDDTDRHRFVASIDGEDVGFLVYYRTQGRHLLVHTEVDGAHEGKGVGSALVRGALDHLSDAGGRIVPICPYVKRWLEGHSEYRTLVDDELETLLRP